MAMEQYRTMRQHLDHLSLDLAWNEGGSCDQICYCSRQVGPSCEENFCCSEKVVSCHKKVNVLQA